MSFSSDTKAELCRSLPNKKCCCIAECYGILLYCNTFTQREIRITTESGEFASLLPRLFKRAFGVQFDILPQDREKGKRTFVLYKDEKLVRICDAFGITRESIFAHHINLGVLEEECCRQSFLRGAFLAGGSVTDPEKRYHLEIVTDHYNVSREMFSLMLDMGLDPHESSRSGTYILYFKQSTAIDKTLTVMGAPVSAMAIMSAYIEKSLRNKVNRTVNCDTANVNKTVDASQQQIDAIMKLKESGTLDTLNEKLRETAKMRLELPELNLTELARAFDPPITKSCLNHRLRKLISMADETEKTTTEEE